MFLSVDPEKCTECGRCTSICALTKSGRILPRKAMIRVDRNWPEVPSVNVCRFERCEGQPCIESCPFEAITVDEQGFVAIIEDKCRGCRKCVSVCPYNAIHMDTEMKKAYKCDLCGGTPACVAECVTEALSFREADNAR